MLHTHVSAQQSPSPFTSEQLCYCRHKSLEATSPTIYHDLRKHMQSATGQSGKRNKKKEERQRENFCSSTSTSLHLSTRFKFALQSSPGSVICLHLLWVFTLVLFFFFIPSLRKFFPQSSAPCHCRFSFRRGREVARSNNSPVTYCEWKQNKQLGVDRKTSFDLPGREKGLRSFISFSHCFSELHHCN